MPIPHQLYTHHPAGNMRLEAKTIASPFLFFFHILEILKLSFKDLEISPPLPRDLKKSTEGP